MWARTLTQPWAGLVASGIKLVENRPRRIINPRGWGTPFAIHASREFDDLAALKIGEIAPELQPSVIWEWPSAIIGVATVVTYVTDARQLDEYKLTEQRRWFFGPIGYVLRDVRALARPVPCRGFQGFWTLPADVEAKVTEQLR